MPFYENETPKGLYEKNEPLCDDREFEKGILKRFSSFYNSLHIVLDKENAIAPFLLAKKGKISLCAKKNAYI